MELEYSPDRAYGFKLHPYLTLSSRPIDALIPTAAGENWLAGKEPGYHWQTMITPAHAGFWLETTLTVEQTVTLNPSMILWISPLDNMDDRQAHTWRQTIVRAPTTNQQGLGGNDLPACYLYDHATKMEAICYFPPDRLQWAAYRFYDFSMREVMSYRDRKQYGLGLIPNSPDVMFTFPPGEHQFAWWLAVRQRETIPSSWEAQKIMIDTITPLLDTQPTLVKDALSWKSMAQNTLKDLAHPASWIDIQGQRGLRAYVQGSSSVGRDAAQGFELMTQLDVLWGLLSWQQATGEHTGKKVANQLQQTLPLFERAQWNYMANNFPPHSGDSFMDTWYFLENALIKLPWIAYLTGDIQLKMLFFNALQGATELAHKTNYLFPLFADADGWQPRGSLLNAGVAGLYAAAHVLASQLNGQCDYYLGEATRALHTMMQLNPSQLTHEPQQLSFGAAAAAYLARRGVTGMQEIAENLVYLSLRMGYWGKDPAVPFYDARGMFQACASLSYPAYKENIETILPWAELLKYGMNPAPLMAAFMNLQRCHNYAYFDPYLRAQYRRGPCPYIPYEDIATSEFPHTAEFGKELYGAGEVFWSALLFESIPAAPDILCLCLDVPCLELCLMPPADKRSYLLYNPAVEERQITFREQAIRLAGQAVTHVKGA